MDIEKSELKFDLNELHEVQQRLTPEQKLRLYDRLQGIVAGCQIFLDSELKHLQSKRREQSA